LFPASAATAIEQRLRRAGEQANGQEGGKMQPGTRVEWAGIVEAREDDDPRDTGGCSRREVDAGIEDIFVCQPA